MKAYEKYKKEKVSAAKKWNLAHPEQYAAIRERYDAKRRIARGLEIKVKQQRGEHIDVNDPARCKHCNILLDRAAGHDCLSSVQMHSDNFNSYDY